MRTALAIKTVTLRELVADAWLAADGDWNKAHEACIDAIDDLPPTSREAAGREALEVAVWYLVKQQASLSRQTIQNANQRMLGVCQEVSATQTKRAAPSMRSAPQDTAAELYALARSWLNYALPGGKKLGDATREDIAVAMKYHEKLAGTHAHKAKWLARLLERVPSGRRVKEVLDSQAIGALWEG